MTITNLFIYLISIIIGILLGMFIMRYFSKIVFFQFENAFEEQINLYKSSSKQTAKEYRQILEQKYLISVTELDKITQNLTTVNNKVIDVFVATNELHLTVNRVKVLESEIIKLKKIITRMEKKNG